MIKITAKDIAKLIGKSPGYTRVILSRRQIKVKPGNLGSIMKLIEEYRGKASYVEIIEETDARI